VFGAQSVVYLGHVILGAGVAMDKQKIQAVLNWPVPRSTHDVHAFLGLIGYYHRFIRECSNIAEPLTKLLRKGGFWWCTETEVAFNALKCALTTAPILQILDFNTNFIMECDASGSDSASCFTKGPDRWHSTRRLLLHDTPS
jgi:hypothetical protein